MRRALRRAAQVFVAAGALGVVSPALAQSSATVGKSVPAPASAKITLVKVETTVRRGGAFDEMEVELGWLANKCTFHHNLSAHVVDGMLEVRGIVPNNFVKEQALKVAREHTPLPIADKVQINPNVAIYIDGAPVEELTQAAAAALADSMGDEANGLEITARDNGVVTIKGAVFSMEDKLTISRKMRRVTGCSCVNNRVTVTPVLRAGHLVTQLTADGSQLVGDAPPPPPIGPLSGQSSQGSPGLMKVPATPAHAERIAMTPKPDLPQYGSGAVTSSPSTPINVTKSTGTTSSAWSDKPTATKLTAPPDSAPKTPAPTASTTVVAKVDQPVIPGSGNAQWPVAHDEKPGHQGYSTSGTVVFDDDLTPPPAPAIKPLPAPPPSKPVIAPAPVATTTAAMPPPFTPAPGATTAVKPPFTPGGTPTSPVTATPITTTGNPFAPVPDSASLKLQQQIKTICGNQARDVQVTVGADKLMHVKVKVDDSKTQNVLTDKILGQVPEMATTNVRLEMEVIGK